MEVTKSHIGQGWTLRNPIACRSQGDLLFRPQSPSRKEGVDRSTTGLTSEARCLASQFTGTPRKVLALDRGSRVGQHGKDLDSDVSADSTISLADEYGNHDQLLTLNIGKTRVHSPVWLNATTIAFRKGRGSSSSGEFETAGRLSIPNRLGTNPTNRIRDRRAFSEQVPSERCAGDCHSEGCVCYAVSLESCIASPNFRPGCQQRIPPLDRLGTG